MEPRTIAIGLIAVVAAFGAAFGISSSGGGKTATAGPATKAESIKVAAPAAVAGVEVGGTLPALKAEKKKAKKKAEKPSTSNTTASTPSTNDTTPQTTAPSTQQNTAPVQNTAPTQNTTKPSPPKNNTPSNNGPVSGGGEDG